MSVRKLALALAASASIGAGSPRAEPQSPIHVVLGPPIVVRQASDHLEMDAGFLLLKLDAGGYRGFTGNQQTFAIDGKTPWAMGRSEDNPVLAGSPRRMVFDRGEARAACGRWLVGLRRQSDRLVGFVHEERACNYKAGQTDMSWAVAVSRDEGLTWSLPQTVVTGEDGPRANGMSGIACGQPLRRGDGRLSAYCLRPSDWRTIAVSAPEGEATVPNWRKWDGTGWNAAGVGGGAAALSGLYMGYYAAYLTDFRLTALLGDNDARGQGLWLSADGLRFSRLPAPLIPAEGFAWKRPDPRELVSYITLYDAATGVAETGPKATLAYTYHEPGSTIPNLVVRQALIERGDDARRPAVRSALTTWRDAQGRRRSSAGPVVGNFSLWSLEGILGYMLTAPPSDEAGVRVEECRVGGDGHSLAVSIACADLGYAKRRLAGWLYANARVGLAPIYMCGGPDGRYASRAAAPACDTRPAGYLWPD